MMNDFYHNDEYVLFEDFKSFDEKDILRLQCGFSQSIIYGISGTKKYDVLELHKNYGIFISNLKLLGKSYDETKHSLVEKSYCEWKNKDIYYKKDEDNKLAKRKVAPVNELNLVEKTLLEIETELLKSKKNLSGK